jgi:protein-disulfide isomerase
MISRVRALLLLLAVLTACASAPPLPTKIVDDRVDPPPKPVAVAGPAESATVDVEPGTAVPVTRSDAARGNPLAPVTLVTFGDYQCPFTARFVTTVAEVERKYGPDKLRFVWKNNPLPFHANAKPAAAAAEAVRALGGPQAFWRFFALAFENPRALSPDSYEAWAEAAGVSRRELADALRGASSEAVLERDHELAVRLGVVGTPISFVNGVLLSGAQPAEKLEALIDQQLAAARALLDEGVPRSRVYATLSDRGFVSPPPPAPSAPEPVDHTVWRVPVDGSPARGPRDARVTIVEFADFECPFSARVQSTIEAIEREYAGKVRLVFKHDPLPFHPRAEPAAELAIQARVERGDAGFWKAHALLFANQTQLADEDLAGYARTLGLRPDRVARAIAKRAHKAVLERDQALADDVEAKDPPTFFINGRRLVGAQPLEKFRAVIDEELASAEARVRAGVRPKDLYDTLMRSAKAAAPVERVVVPAPTTASPGKGAPPGAKVVVQMFADFQCPFCRRAQPTIDQLVDKHPGQVRVVFRHLPLPFHSNAALAAEASMEAFAQKGDAGFWAYADLLWAAQGGDGLERPSLEHLAAKAGLDVDRFRAALDRRTHRAAVEADMEVAKKASIWGTPSFAVGDHFVSGAQPLSTFEQAVQRALGPKDPIDPAALHGAPKPEPRTGPPPPAPPSTPPPPPAAGALFGAKHLLVMYAGSTRALASITRSREEARGRAEEAARKLRAGARWEDVVAAYSDEPGAAQRAGDLGTFRRGAMVPEFQGAVEAIQVGAISGAFESTFGFHVIVRTQ